jgi:hypothetical protein
MATEVRDELTWQVPFELVDALLEETQTRERRLRDLPARAGVFFVLASLAAPGSPPGRLTSSHQPPECCADRRCHPGGAAVRRLTWWAWISQSAACCR